jgi:hypothetical protein
MSHTACVGYDAATRACDKKGLNVLVLLNLSDIEYAKLEIDRVEKNCVVVTNGNIDLLGLIFPTD